MARSHFPRTLVAKSFVANMCNFSGGHFAKYWGGGGGIFNMYAFGVRLRYANLSNIMLGISNSLFDILL